jgi:hypothetical protein
LVDKVALTPDHVARVLEHALSARRPKTRYVVGWDARVQGKAARLLSDRVRDRLILKFLGL